MRKLVAPLFVSALALHAFPIFAQTPPQTKTPQANAEEMRKMMEASIDTMVPTMGRMAEVNIDAQLRIAEKPKTAARIAKFKRNLYDSLVRGGFSKVEALQITVGTGMLAGAGVGK